MSADSRATLIHTEHSKGGLLREYTELLGTDAQRDRFYRYTSAQQDVVFSGARRITFPSRGAQDLFETFNGTLPPETKAKTLVIHNGVPPPSGSAPPTSPQSPTANLLSISAHAPEKGIDRLLVALSECLKKGLNLDVEIAGSFGRITPTLESLRDSLRLKNNVTFLGPLRQAVLHAKLRAADLVIACPRVVVFDLALLEAMAAGKAVLTSKLQGNVEALGGEYPAFFDRDDEIPDAIARLLADRNALTELGGANRRRFQQEFTSARMARRFCDLYFEVRQETAAFGGGRRQISSRGARTMTAPPPVH